MAGKKINDYWAAEIKEWAAKNPSAGATAIETMLWKEGDIEGHGNPPSARTIGRELRKFRALKPEEQTVYKEFHWPHSIGSLVPWEASRVALDVLKEEWVRHKQRPSIRRVLWHWRVSLAIPGANYEGRDPYVNQILWATNLPRSFDWPLAFGIWFRSDADQEAQDRANQEIRAIFPDGYPEDMKEVA